MKVVSLYFAAMGLSWLGYLDQGLKLSQEALALGQALAHPYSLAATSFFVGLFHASRREVSAAHERAEAALNLSTEGGFLFWLAVGTILRGWVLAEQGYEAEGISQMRQGLADFRATGGEIIRPGVLAMLAEIYSRGGQTEAAWATLSEALALVDKTGERWWEADMYRLKGELLLKQGEPEAEAEACFFQALEIAQHQQAKFWELRATVSLARLWQAQGKREEARQMLAEIYNWFTEGFDTVDLQEAGVLLAELS